MNIGMIVHAYYLKDARVRRYAEMLAGEGHAVDVLCLLEGDEPKMDTHLGVNIHRVKLSRRRGGRLSYIIEYLSSFIRFFTKLNRLHMAGKRYDILHIHNMPDFLVLCALFQKLSGTKVILDVHDPMPELFQSKYMLGSGHWLTRLLCVEERLSARFASAVITANHAFADILAERSAPSTKITVVMNAANEMFFLSEEKRRMIRNTKPPGDFHVIYIGTVAPRYGVEDTIRAIAKLREKRDIPGLRFSIIPKIGNEGIYVDEMTAEIGRCDLVDVFTMMEPVPHDCMPDVIAGADAVIYTPLPDVHMDIALSLKIPEAIAVGCPIVATKLSVNSRYFGDDALFTFEPGDTEGCAVRLLEVHDDQIETAARVSLARERLDQISWEKQKQVYRLLLLMLSKAKSN